MCKQAHTLIQMGLSWPICVPSINQSRVLLIYSNVSTDDFKSSSWKDNPEPRASQSSSKEKKMCAFSPKHSFLRSGFPCAHCFWAHSWCQIANEQADLAVSWQLRWKLHSFCDMLSQNRPCSVAFPPVFPLQCPLHVPLPLQWLLDWAPFHEF